MSFDFCKHITVDALEEFFGKLKELKKLKELLFYFYEVNSLQDNAIRILAKELSNMKDLRKLVLKIGMCKKLTKKSMIDLSGAISKLPRLKHLYLNCHAMLFKSDVIKNVATAIKQKASLETLILNFEECKNISEKGIADLSESLKDIFSLKNIELNFTSCQTTDGALIALNKALSSLKKLKNLSLNMRNSDKLSDAAVEHLN